MATRVRSLSPSRRSAFPKPTTLSQPSATFDSPTEQLPHPSPVEISSSAAALLLLLAAATTALLAAAAVLAFAAEEDVGAARVREVAAGIRSEDGGEISHVLTLSPAKNRVEFFVMGGFQQTDSKKLDEFSSRRYAVFMSDKHKHKKHCKGCGKRCGPGDSCKSYGCGTPRACFTHVAGANACSTYQNVLTCCKPRPRCC